MILSSEHMSQFQNSYLFKMFLDAAYFRSKNMMKFVSLTINDYKESNPDMSLP